MRTTPVPRNDRRSSTPVWTFSYLAVFFGALVGLAAITAALTIAVDPYYLFGTPRIAGFNKFKPAADNRAVTAKVALLERVRPRTLLLGNSRVEVGFNPKSEEWPEKMQPVFNAGLSGRGLDISAKVMEDALSVPGLHFLMVGVDFIDFVWAGSKPLPLSPVDAGPDQDVMRLLPNLAPNPTFWRARLEDRLSATLTLGAVTDSLATMWEQWQRHPGTITTRGFDPLEQYKGYVRTHGFRDLFDQKQNQYSERFARFPHPDFKQPYAVASFAALREIITVAQRQNLDVTLVVYPYHAWAMDLMRRDGLWPSFEAWKRALVDVVAALDAHDRIRIFDFSGYNAHTTEPVPARGDTTTDMKWYWEPGHFRPALGDQIIRRLYDGEATSFGRILSPATIDQAIRAVREEAHSHSEKAALNR